VKAKVVHHSDLDCSEQVNVNGHELQIGGRDGDGFCYAHQSWTCFDKLTNAEWDAIREAQNTYYEALQ
jgi:hypothetical protein